MYFCQGAHKTCDCMPRLLSHECKATGLSRDQTCTTAPRTRSILISRRSACSEGYSESRWPHTPTLESPSHTAGPLPPEFRMCLHAHQHARTQRNATRRDATRRDTRATRRLRGATLRDARVTNVRERRVEDHRRIEASKRENERASRANARCAVHARSSAGHARARPQEAN